MSGQGLSFLTSDDVELIYDDEGSGRTFLFLHGYSCRRGHWEYQREALLAGGHRVIALDLRGHGDSQKPQHGQTLARMGQDVRELIEGLGLEQTCLVAHSMGVSVSLAMFMISGFEGIERFVNIDQTPKIINDEGWHWGIKGVSWENFYDCVNFRIKWSDEEQEPSLPPGSAMAEEHWASFDHAAVSKLFLNHFVSDWRDILPRISVPTWVVTSRFTSYYDSDHPEGMEWIAKQIPDSRLTIFEHSGHQPHVSEAAEFNRKLLEFCAVTNK
ncbi:alpha/beta fold hydrolase [Nocardia carnea]|uniref:alpha/beta fold hydrolase n=1 Tax=Nocardia carnea TaxID=37328 RepID=UPI0024546C0C|nr:alpha/beta hydrolase [Nocardia carnea]